MEETNIKDKQVINKQINLKIIHFDALWKYFCLIKNIETTLTEESFSTEENKKYLDKYFDSLLNEKFELFDWNVPYNQMEIHLGQEYLFIFITDAGFLVVEKNGKFSLHMTYERKNVINFGDNCNEIKYISIDSLKMFDQMSLLINKLISIEVVTITNSQCLNNKLLFRCINLIKKMISLKIIRGEIDQKFLYQFFNLSPDRENISFYIIGKEEKIDEILHQKLLYIVGHKRYLIKQLITPWKSINENKINLQFLEAEDFLLKVNILGDELIRHNKQAELMNHNKSINKFYNQ